VTRGERTCYVERALGKNVDVSVGWGTQRVTTRSLAHVETAPTLDRVERRIKSEDSGPLRNRSDGNVCVLQLHVTTLRRR